MKLGKPITFGIAPFRDKVFDLIVNQITHPVYDTMSNYLIVRLFAAERNYGNG